MSYSNNDSKKSYLIRFFERCLWLGGRILLLIPAEQKITILTGVNKGRRWIRGAANAPEWLGIYEASKQKALVKLIKPGMLTFDIGANAGFYTLAMSRLSGAKGRVFAFEPFPANCAKIKKHLIINQATNVTLITDAVADEVGKIFFQAGSDDFTGRIATNGEIEVSVITLDGIVENQNTGDPDLIKIDVEGAESRVLLGARGILQRGKPVIMLALHGDEQRKICYNLLVEFGYNITTLNGTNISGEDSMPDEVIAQRIVSYNE